MHFNIILQCMRISSKFHITLRCSGQNVRDFQFRNACYIRHPLLVSHIFTSRIITIAWKLQIRKHLSSNFVTLSFPCLFFHIRSSAAALRFTIIPLPTGSSPRVTRNTKQHVELQMNAEALFWNEQGSSQCSPHHLLLHCSCWYPHNSNMQYGDCPFPNTQKCWVGSQPELKAEHSAVSCFKIRCSSRNPKKLQNLLWNPYWSTISQIQN